MTETDTLLDTDSFPSQESLFGNVAALRQAAWGDSSNFVMAETNGFRQFLILLYKGLLLRKRHYIITAFEVIIPVFIASIPAIIQSELSSAQPIINTKDVMEQNPLWVNATIYEPFDPYTTKKHKSYDIEFIYVPENNLTAKFIEEAVAKFKESTFVTGEITTKGVVTEKDMELYCLYKQKEEASVIFIGTVFNNFKENLPVSLDYKIRYSDGVTSFNTQVKYRVNGPQSKNVYTDDTFFLGWQTAVEQTFIQRKITEKGDNIGFKVWMQRFPYPEHRDSNNILTAINIIPWVIGYGYLVFIMNLVKRIIEEKANRSKELLKMMGMTDCVYWLSTFMNYFIIAVVTMFIITIIYKATLKNSFVFVKYTDFMLLFFLLLLFMTSLILFCMAFSVFFNRNVIASVLLFNVYIISFTLLMTTYFLLESEVKYIPLATIKKIGICLFPPGSLLTMFYMISFYESSGEGMQWSNLAEFSVVPDLNMLMVIGSIFLSCIIYIFLLWYFDKVWPWQLGVPQPFYFLFTRSYWFGPKQQVGEELQLVQNHNDGSSDFFEEEPTGATPGVIIKNLSKEFRTGMRTKMAVNNLSLNIYQGQITALLGHNGAGKTTSINILTGLFRPTSGSASINGLDILTETTRARRGLGVCPQHNVLYDTLTVEEHLKIYAAIKGVPWNRLNEEITTVLDSLKLAEKRHELTKNLSGGMKRKLSLGIAIIGGSKVLFLDEPTSGLDVEARRSVWDALLDIRHNRTIILTTHYMEEADVLGDRIAIMAEGEVQCCGSPIFLKNKFGTGYHLHAVKDDTFDIENLTSLINKHIPGSVVENELEKEISFNLASGTGAGFGDMFEEVENRKTELGVISYGITITTMEDVFLNVANISDLRYSLTNKSDNKNGSSIEIEDVNGGLKKLVRHRNPGNQLFGLLLKRFHYAKRYWTILISQLALPFLIICYCLYLTKGTGSHLKYDPLKLDIVDVYGSTEGFYYSKNGQTAKLTDDLKTLLEANSIDLKNVSDPTQYILTYGREDLAKYLKMLLIGGAIVKSQSGELNLTAWYNGEPSHVLPMSLSFMHGALLKYVTGTGTITLTNAPLPVSLSFGPNDDIRIMERIMAAVCFPMALTILSASFVLLPAHERVSKAKLLQLMSGIPAILYWFAMFVWDFLIYICVCILLIIPFAIFSHYAFFSIHSNAIGAALLLFLLYGWASIPFSYVMSFIFKKGSNGFSAIVTIAVIFGSGVVSTLVPIIIFSHGYSIKEVNGIVWSFRLLPPFSIALAFSNLFGTAYYNSYCESVSAEDLQYNCNSPIMTDWNPLFKCCKDLCGDRCLQEISIMTLDENGCGRDSLFLILDGFLYFAIVLLLETRASSYLSLLLKHLWMKIRKQNVSQVIQENITQDSDVTAEEERVHDLQATRPELSDEALMVVDLTKVFKNFYAVDHLTFGIHEEECFGLLGVNGAGKTTTFRMLTGDCLPTEGNAFIKDSSIRSNLKKFQSYIGYCPQFDALIDRLTGRETLSLFGRLRGLSGSELEDQVNKLIKMTDLSVHADKESQLYSGGNKRKLSIGISLIGSPPLLLMDEPTAGVDPVSRRKIWKVLAESRNVTGAAIILTTHSMEESEALCSRLAIMVNGRFRCLGSIQQLKSKYGQGYSLIVKVKRQAQDDAVTLNEIKAHVQSHLSGAMLKDDHQGMLQYHVIDPSITLSYLFKFMSLMKSQFDLEDYLISDTSLEQIFLTFARAQRNSH